MEKKELNRYRLTLDDELFTDMNLISLVDDPAIEQNAMLFAKVQENKVKENFALAKGITERQEITGPIMRSNFDIYRYNWFTGEEYFVYFTKEDTKACMNAFMKNSNNFATSFNHNYLLKNTFLSEIWYVVDPETDKSKALGFKNVKVGDIYGTFKCESTEIWNELIKKYVKGFSIEGFFTQILDQFAKQNTFNKEQEQNNPKTENMENEKQEVFIDDEDLTPKQIENLIKAVFSNKTKLATIYEVNKYEIEIDQDTIEVGTVLTTSWSDGNETYTNNLSDGEYVLEDGRKIQVDGDAKVVLITPSETQVVTE